MPARPCLLDEALEVLQVPAWRDGRSYVGHLVVVRPERRVVVSARLPRPFSKHVVDPREQVELVLDEVHHLRVGQHEPAVLRLARLALHCPLLGHLVHGSVQLEEAHADPARTRRAGSFVPLAELLGGALVVGLPQKVECRHGVGREAAVGELEPACELVQVRRPMLCAMQGRAADVDNEPLRVGLKVSGFDSRIHGPTM